MIYLIYETTNLINGKKYIGMHQTNDINDGYLGSGVALCAAIQKYGSKNFKKRILHQVDTYEKMVKLEQELITEEIVKSPEYYNLRIGGQGGALTEDAKAKIGKKSKERWNKMTVQERTEHIHRIHRNYTSERRRELTTGKLNGMYEKKHTEETKKLLKSRSAKKDCTILEWHHDSGDVFIGTMVDFYTKYNLCRAWTSRVRRGIKKKIKGWKYVREL